ncbi:MAG: magnesium transporter [Clostridiaceae bacterium]|nr:magnesium transporter [Clostridiaceae bacterium]
MERLYTDYEHLKTLVEEGKFLPLRRELLEMNEIDIAEFLEQLPMPQRIIVFRLLPKQLAADVFAYLDSGVQTEIVLAISNRELYTLVDGMYVDDTVDFLEEVPANVVRRVMAVADRETRETINKFLQYPENSAGSIMTSEMMELHDRYTVAQAMTQIRTSGEDRETIYICYCISDSRRLVGTVELRDLIFHEPEEILRDIMDADNALICVNTHDDQEKVADIARHYDLLSVPVTDNEGRLVGIVTIDDIVDIIEDENTEDLERMALMQPADDTYLKTGVFTMFRNRIVWLAILMVSATFTGIIIEGFESALAAMAGLTAAIPMLMDTGGNSGNQASTLVIRGLALGEIRIRDYIKVVWKELRVSVLCGAALAAINFLRMLIIGTHNIPMILVVCGAMFCAVVFAKIVGSSLPILAKLIHLDPALMAGPMITTIVDAVTLLIYFFLAQTFLFV